MNEYYVYKIESNNLKEKKYAFVASDKIKDFAEEGYDPLLMEFTGIMVEAESPTEANTIYQCPRDNEGYYMVEEPFDTVVRKTEGFKNKQKNYVKELKDFQAVLEKLRDVSVTAYLSVVVKEIAKDFAKLNEDMSNLTRLINMSSTEGHDITEEEIYNRIRDRMLNQFKDDYKYKKPSK